MVVTQLPKISVIIPVLNGAKTLEYAIRSVLDQHYENVELIILDAGSTDGTVDIIKRYQQSIYYWHSQPDGSGYHAINIGIKKSTGRLIAQLMADDWFEPGIFQAVARAFVDNPEVDIISCGGRVVTYDTKRGKFRVISAYTTSRQLDLNFYNICFAIPAMSSRFLSKSLFKKIGYIYPFDMTGQHIFSGDREFLLRAIVHGSKNLIINDLGHTYLAHKESATFNKHRPTQLKIYQEHMAIAESYLQKYNLPKQQKLILRYWYVDQSIRFLLCNLLGGNLVIAWQAAKEGIRKFKIRWIIMLFTTPCRIILNRISTRLRRKQINHARCK